MSQNVAANRINISRKIFLELERLILDKDEPVSSNGDLLYDIFARGLTTQFLGLTFLLMDLGPNLKKARGGIQKEKA